MYKQFIICVVIIIIIVIAEIFTQNYTKKSVSTVTDNLDIIQEKIDTNDKVVSKKEFDDMINDWDHRYEILAYYLEHDELEKIKIELVSLEADIKVEDFDQATNDIKRAIFLLEHIKQKSALQIKNIF